MIILKNLDGHPMPFTLILANSTNTNVKAIIMRTGAIMERKFRLRGLNRRSRSELATTEMELKAIARPASSGFRISPNATKTRAAIGMPITL